jgi:hypothetical protein
LFLEEYNFSFFFFHEGVCTFLDLDHLVVEAIEYNTLEHPDACGFHEMPDSP